MIIDAEKKQIIREILRTNDEWVLKAIRKLLDIEVDELDEEHKLVLNERIAEYESNPDNTIDWEKLREELLND